ncbi:hypothetical protein B0H34DRAFT_798098 [Crassisporium funariophilum]|nr:hypothetical protein B0H34DRAFT_798098 [Crassisporium funariophilum]
MPAIPLRKRLLRGAFAYAKRLQDLCLCFKKSQDSSMSASEDESQAEFRDILNANPSSDVDMDNDNTSSLSSLSSVSSLSSFLSLGSEEIEPGNKADPAMPSVPVIEDDSEDKDDALYIKRLAAVRERIHYLETTRVLRPNRVHKLSQLALVLITFKEDDPKRFWCNV